MSQVPFSRSVLLTVLALSAALALVDVAAGLLLGPQKIVNDFPTGKQHYSTICANNAGRVLVVWSSVNQVSGASEDDVFCRLFASGASVDGTFNDAAEAAVPISSETLVNTPYTSGSQIDPACTALEPSGDFVVTYSSDGQDGSMFGVFAQKISGTDGTLLGTPVVINTYAEYLQVNAKLASLSNDRFVVVFDSIFWHQVYPVFQFDVRAQLFRGATMTKLGGEFSPPPFICNNMPTWFASVATSASDLVVVAYEVTCPRGGDGDGSIFAAAFDASTDALSSAFTGNEVHVNAGAATGVQAYPRVAIAGPTALFAWITMLTAQNSATVQIRAMDLATFGFRSATPVTLSVQTGDSNTYVHIASSLGGEASTYFIVVFNTAGNRIMGQVVSVTGSPVGLPFLINVADPGTSASAANTNSIKRFHQHAAFLRSGSRWMAVWHDEDVNDVFMQAFDDRAVPPLPAPVAQTAPGAQPVGSSIWLPDFASVSTFQQHGFVCGSGRSLLSVFTENFGGGEPNDIGARFLIAQSSGAVVRPTAFATLAVVANDAFVQSDPKCAATRDGQFTVVWTSNNQDGSAEGVYARRLMRTGSGFASSEFQVHTTTAGAQLGASITSVQLATDPPGGSGGSTVAVVWASGPSSTQLERVVLQLIQGSTRVGPTELAVNIPRAGCHVQPPSTASFRSIVVTAFATSCDPPDQRGFDVYLTIDLVNATALAITTTRLAEHIPVVDTSNADGDQVQPSVAVMKASGTALVAWHDASTSSIVAQLVDIGGTLLGSNFAVRHAGVGPVRRAPIASAGWIGVFAVAYAEYGSASPGSPPLARVAFVDCNGAPFGSPVTVGASYTTAGGGPSTPTSVHFLSDYSIIAAFDAAPTSSGTAMRAMAEVLALPSASVSTCGKPIPVVAPAGAAGVAGLESLLSSGSDVQSSFAPICTCSNARGETLVVARRYNAGQSPPLQYVAWLRDNRGRRRTALPGEFVIDSLSAPTWLEINGPTTCGCIASPTLPISADRATVAAAPSAFLVVTPRFPLRVTKVTITTSIDATPVVSSIALIDTETPPEQRTFIRATRIGALSPPRDAIPTPLMVMVTWEKATNGVDEIGPQAIASLRLTVRAQMYNLTASGFGLAVSGPPNFRPIAEGHTERWCAALATTENGAVSSFSTEQADSASMLDGILLMTFVGKCRLIRQGATHVSSVAFLSALRVVPVSPIMSPAILTSRNVEVTHISLAGLATNAMSVLPRSIAMLCWCVRDPQTNEVAVQARGFSASSRAFVSDAVNLTTPWLGSAPDSPPSIAATSQYFVIAFQGPSEYLGVIFDCRATRVGLPFALNKVAAGTQRLLFMTYVGGMRFSLAFASDSPLHSGVLNAVFALIDVPSVPSCNCDSTVDCSAHAVGPPIGTMSAPRCACACQRRFNGSSWCDRCDLDATDNLRSYPQCTTQTATRTMLHDARRTRTATHVMPLHTSLRSATLTLDHAEPQGSLEPPSEIATGTPSPLPNEASTLPAMSDPVSSSQAVQVATTPVPAPETHITSTPQRSATPLLTTTAQRTPALTATRGLTTAAVVSTTRVPWTTMVTSTSMTSQFSTWSALLTTPSHLATTEIVTDATPSRPQSSTTDSAEPTSTTAVGTATPTPSNGDSNAIGGTGGNASGRGDAAVRHADSEGGAVGVIAGSTVAGVLLLVAAVCALMYASRKLRRHRPDPSTAAAGGASTRSFADSRHSDLSTAVPYHLTVDDIEADDEFASAKVRSVMSPSAAAAIGGQDIIAMSATKSQGGAFFEMGEIEERFDNPIFSVDIDSPNWAAKPTRSMVRRRSFPVLQSDEAVVPDAQRAHHRNGGAADAFTDIMSVELVENIDDDLYCNVVFDALHSPAY